MVGVEFKGAFRGETRRSLRSGRVDFQRNTLTHIRTLGFGVYQYSNPFFRYEGTWQDGKKHGKHIAVECICVCWCFRFDQGFGKLMFGDGSYYQGEFANNEIMGQGTRYFASSRNTYTGHFYYGNI